MGSKRTAKGHVRVQRDGPTKTLDQRWLHAFAALLLGLLIGFVRWRWRSQVLPYVHLAKSLTADDLLGIEAQYQDALAGGNDQVVNQTRQFGNGADYLAGHRVTYLDPSRGHLAEVVLPKLLATAARADHRAGWRLLAGGHRVVQQLTPRCAELIEYEAFEADPQRSHSLGWHSDGSTLLTVAVALSNAADYDGGEFEIHPSEGKGTGHSSVVAVNRPAPGDALVWRGWEEHRVRPLQRGLRRVLVVELWRQPSHASLERPLDTSRSFQDALALAPNAPGLHSGLGYLLASRERHEDAELSFTTALKLAPARADIHVGLGKTFYLQRRLGAALKHLKGLQSLGGISDVSDVEEKAEQSFLKALELDPALAEAHKYLSTLYEDRGDHHKSSVHFEASKFHS